MKILFVCTGNTCRSPMAEAIMKKIIRDKNIPDVQCISAGLCADDGDNASLNSIKVLNEIGIDLSSHKSKKLSRNTLGDFDIIVPMTENHNIFLLQLGCEPSKIFSSSVNIGDPYGGSLEKYRTSRSEILKLCEELSEKLINEQ